MKVSVSIGGVGTSAARMRAMAFVRQAIAKREAERQDERRLGVAVHADDHQQQTRGK